MNKRKIFPGSIARSLAGFVLSALFVLPLYWAFIASLQPLGAPPPETISWWISDPHWENYRLIFQIVPLAKYTWNSVFIVIIAIPLTVIIASLAGFSLTQLGRNTRSIIINVSLGMLLIPASAVWLFRFQLLIWLGLLDSLWALIMPAFAGSTPLFVLLFYWNYLQVPEETVDAARLAGADAWTIWRKLAVPLSLPTILGVSVLTFVMYWSDFISPVLYLFSSDRYTLPIGLQLINQIGSTNWPILMAASMFMTAPVLLFFLLLQRYFLSDLSLAGLFERN